MTPDWGLVIQSLSAVATVIGLLLMARELRVKIPALQAQTGASAMAATRDEFEIMELAAKRQEATMQEQRAAIAELRLKTFNMELDHAKAITAMQQDFAAKLHERDDERQVEKSRLEEALQKLRADSEAKDGKIADLEQKLAKVNKELIEVNKELEREREGRQRLEQENKLLKQRIVELEKRPIPQMDKPDPGAANPTAN